MARNRHAPARAALAVRPRPLPAVGPGAKHLLDQIAVAEGTDEAKARRRGYGSGYEVIYGYRRSAKPLTAMTLDEVDALQAQLGAHTPVGRYQLLRATLQELRRRHGLSGSELFSPKLQDQLARARMRLRRYDDPSASPAEIQRAFAREWASVPDVTGCSRYTITRETRAGAAEERQPTGLTSAGFRDALAVARRLDGGG